LELTPEIEANWRSLASIALENHDIVVAEHCYAALGDIAKATYLRKTQKLGRQYEQEYQKDPINFYKVQARLAILDK
jgi:intraflagellar transport protein 172